MKYVNRYSNTNEPDEQGRWARDVVYKGVSIAWINRLQSYNKTVYAVTLHFPTGQGVNPNVGKVCYSYESSQEFVEEMWDYFLNQISCMIEFNTSKGEFVVRQSNKLLVTKNTVKMIDFQTNIHVINGVKYECICKLSEATEVDAEGVVEERQLELYQKTQGFYKYYDYMSRNELVISCLESAIDSLHSLLKSKGIDVNNGNWYLFKKI